MMIGVARYLKLNDVIQKNIDDPQKSLRKKRFSISFHIQSSHFLIKSCNQLYFKVSLMQNCEMTMVNAVRKLKRLLECAN